jgi:hypothetical protein
VPIQLPECDQCVPPLEAGIKPLQVASGGAARAAVGSSAEIPTTVHTGIPARSARFPKDPLRLGRRAPLIDRFLKDRNAVDWTVVSRTGDLPSNATPHDAVIPRNRLT